MVVSFLAQLDIDYGTVEKVVMLNVYIYCVYTCSFLPTGGYLDFGIIATEPKRPKWYPHKSSHQSFAPFVLGQSVISIILAARALPRIVLEISGADDTDIP
jgi:hypothetical protein